MKIHGEAGDEAAMAAPPRLWGAVRLWAISSGLALRFPAMVKKEEPLIRALA